MTMARVPGGGMIIELEVVGVELQQKQVDQILNGESNVKA